MKHGYTEAIQIGLTAGEILVALQIFEMFYKESFSGKSHFDSKTKKWIIDENLTLPSWKHMSHGGHRKHYWNVKRKSCGTFLYGYHVHGQDLSFRRQDSRTKRIFCVQRLDTIQCVLCNNKINACFCDEGEPSSHCISLLKNEDLHFLKTHKQRNFDENRLC